MKKEDWGVIIELLKNEFKNDKARIICTVLLAILEVIRAYIGILLLGKITDLFALGYSANKFILYVVVAFVIKFACVLIYKMALKYYDTRLDYTKDIETKYMNEKAMSFDYEFLEDPSVSDLRYRSFGKSYYGITGWCLVTVQSLLRGIFSIIITTVIVGPMLTQGLLKSGSIASKVLSFLTIALIVILTMINYRTGIHYTSTAKNEINKAENLYNRKQYYMEKLSDTEFQKDIRISNLQKVIAEDISNMFRALRESEYKNGSLYIMRERFGGCLMGLNCIAIYLFTGISAYMGFMSAGSVIIMASSILQFSDQMLKLGTAFGNMKSASLFARDYLDFMKLDSNNKVSKNENVFSVPAIEKIEFENVSFKYPNEDNYVLKNVSMDLDMTEKVAIVGKNGSGKTTLIKLLCGLYKDYEGRIKINGIDIRNFKKEDYWKKISCVFQDFNIFSFSVRENFGGSEDSGKICEALNKSGVNVEDIDDKVGKNIYLDGKNFSGGEKQKMAIARAIYKDADLVIMDEPTAALDPIAESEIFTGFDRLISGRGGIYISHRLSSCKFCKRIIVLNEGKVVQQGTHHQLLLQEGDYKELWNSQRECYE